MEIGEKILNKKFSLVLCAIFSVVMVIYVYNPRTFEDIKSIELIEEKQPVLTVTKKEKRLAEDGEVFQISDIVQIKEIIGYMESVEYRKPMRMNPDVIDNLSPCYVISIVDDDGEQLYANILGESYLGINDDDGTYRYYIPTKENKFDVGFLEKFCE